MLSARATLSNNSRSSNMRPQNYNKLFVQFGYIIEICMGKFSEGLNPYQMDMNLNDYNQILEFWELIYLTSGN